MLSITCVSANSYETWNKNVKNLKNSMNLALTEFHSPAVSENRFEIRRLFRRIERTHSWREAFIVGV